MTFKRSLFLYALCILENVPFLITSIKPKTVSIINKLSDVTKCISQYAKLKAILSILECMLSILVLSSIFGVSCLRIM